MEIGQLGIIHCVATRILCVPNFSEGRNEQTIHQIAQAVRLPGVQVHHLSWDYDHNRMVLAFSGSPRQVARAVLQAGVVAVERIDLRAHQGAHPRIGAVDVVPFVPLEGITREQAVAFSLRVARRFAQELKVPVYLYEHSAREGRPRDLPTLRKGGYEAWVGKRLEGLRRPDFGPARLHPTAGATIMGVRDPLVAFNLNLRDPRPDLAKAIAQRLRTERETNPALKGVRALGLWLPTRQIAQVSLNITQPDATDLYQVVQYVRLQAQSLGTDIAQTELIGVIGLESCARAIAQALLCPNLQAEQIV